jgi:hypothetical protein
VASNRCRSNERSSRQTRYVRFRVIGCSLLEEVGLALQGNHSINEVEWVRDVVYLLVPRRTVTSVERIS